MAAAGTAFAAGSGVPPLAARPVLPILVAGLGCTQMLDGDRFDLPPASDAALVAIDAGGRDLDASPAPPPADACAIDGGPADAGSAEDPESDGDGDGACMHACAARAQSCRDGCAGEAGCEAACAQGKKDCQRACRASAAAQALAVASPAGARRVTPSPE